MRLLTLILLCLTTPAQAEVWDCEITRDGVLIRHEAAIPRLLRIELPDDAPPRVFGEVIHRAGLPPQKARLERQKGTRAYLAWMVKPLPRALLPREAAKFHEPAVQYRARLDRATGALWLTGWFVTRHSSANPGQNLRGWGLCRTTAPPGS